MKRICDDFAYGDGPIETCFWAEVPAPRSYPSLEGRAQTDIAVIGSGFTGLSAALRLAEAGREVTILDAQTPGWGASGRNGGFCCVGGAKASDASMAKRVGKDGARDYRLAERDAVRFAEALIDRLDLDVDRHSKGETLLAHRTKDVSTLHEEAEHLHALTGETARIIERQDMAREGYGHVFHGAMEGTLGFALNPRKYLYGLAEAACSAGVSIYAQTPAISVDRDASGYLISTPQGTLRAAKVIFATNGYSSEDVPGWMRGRYMPVQSSIIVTRELTSSEIDRAAWFSNQMCYDTRNLLHYFRLMPDRRFLFGMRGGVTTGHASHTAIRKRIDGHFADLFPEWSGVETPWYWSGFVCMTYGLTPFSGAIPGHDGLYASYAYHGNGVSMGTYSGALIADSILGRTDLRHPAIMQEEPKRFPGGPWRRLSLAPAYFGYSLIDR